MPLILGTNSIKDTTYDVANSLRFDNDSSDSLSRTPSSTSNRRTFTFSTWFKLSGTDGSFISAGTDISNGPLFIIDILSGGNEGILRVEDTVGGNNVIGLRTTRKLRDNSAWMNVVVGIDTTQGTASNRVKVYINGVQETSFGTETYPSQNLELSMNQNHDHRIGTRAANTSGKFWDGYLCETVLIDGQQLDATSFGEFDSDSGIWKPIDVSGLTFGTNGFYLDFENSGSLGADVSGNGNNFTLNNLTSIDQTTDTCTNNFAVLNALDNYYPDSTLSEGNTQTVIGAGDWTPIKATFGLTTGKWYWEIKHSAVSSGSSYATIGVDSNQATGDQQRGGAGTNDYSYWYNGELRTGDSAVTTGVGTYGVGDIIGVALDLDNNKLYFSKNGTFVNSGDPTSGSTGTGAMSITSASSTSLGAYFPEVGFYDNTNTGTFQCNFGNPAFSISSGNSDGNGYGNFGYSVPSGYYSLCTKNLAEYG